ncbi:MAG: hypothetical protein V4581_10320 [Bacteroidota bacterium]
MEHVITTGENGNALNAFRYEMFAADFEKEAREVKEAEEASCCLLLKNLLKTNLKLLKLNEITNIMLF